jgi:hypothetical protein
MVLKNIAAKSASYNTMLSDAEIVAIKYDLFSILAFRLLDA